MYCTYIYYPIGINFEKVLKDITDISYYTLKRLSVSSV